MKNRCRLLIAFAFLLLADGRTAPLASAAQETFHKVGHFSGSSMGADAHIYEARREGIGVVYSTVSSFGPDRELVVRRDPRDTSPIVAYLDYRPMSDGGWEIASEASEPGLVEEFAHATDEDVGLVVDATKAGWVRAVYGYTAKGDVRVGWVKLVPARVTFVSYDELIRTQSPLLARPDEVQLFDAPNGRRVPFRLVPDGGNYASYKLEVLKIEANWIQIALEVPNTHPCSDYADAKVQRSTTAWVRRHDSRGRYQVWYVTDSC